MFNILENQIGSRLLLPGNERYEETRKVWNTAVEKQPAAIVVCESPHYELILVAC